MLTYCKDLPCASIKRMGALTRPTSSKRFGSTASCVEGALQAVCFGFVKQSCMQRRAKLKVSSEPESTGMRCVVPNVGQGAREARKC